jgi:hypothetical protein
MYNFKYIIILTLIIIFIVYISSNYINKFPDNIQILQTSLENFYDDLLLEKQPIIIQDRIKDIYQFIDLLKYIYDNKIDLINKEIPIEYQNKLFINKYRYVLIYNNIDNFESIEEKDDEGIILNTYDKEIPINVYISLPNNISNDEYNILKKYTIYDVTDINPENYSDKSKIIIIKLYPFQTLILPYKWLFMTHKPLHTIYLNDTLYKIFRYF